jgi:hypothetical protein
MISGRPTHIFLASSLALGIACARTPARTVPGGKTDPMARIARTTDPQAELVATAINYRRIDPTWIDNATDEEGYRIERHEAQTADSLFTQVPSNTTEYADNTPSLLPNRQYCYRCGSVRSRGGILFERGLRDDGSTSRSRLHRNSTL